MYEGLIVVALLLVAALIAGWLTWKWQRSEVAMYDVAYVNGIYNVQYITVALTAEQAKHWRIPGNEVQLYGCTMRTYGLINNRFVVQRVTFPKMNHATLRATLEGKYE